jgi:hypothetical protein
MRKVLMPTAAPLPDTVTTHPHPAGCGKWFCRCQVLCKKTNC